MDIKNALRNWVNTKEFKNKLKGTNEVISEALHSCKKSYIAFSGGKDSTVMLNLVLQIKPGCMVFHWDYGKFMPRQIEREIIRNMKKLGAINYMVRTSKKYRYKNSNKVWYKEFFGKITSELIQEGYDLVFVGLRREESLRRKRRIDKNISLTSIKECWPIADWGWKDIWAYIFSNGLPYASAYDKYCPVLGWDKARFTTFFDPEFDKFGSPNIDGVLMWRFRNIDSNKEGRANK